MPKCFDCMPACMWTTLVKCIRRPDQGTDTLEPELQMVVCFRVASTQVLMNIRGG